MAAAANRRVVSTYRPTDRPHGRRVLSVLSQANFPATKLLPFIRETVNNVYISVRRKGFDPKAYRDESVATSDGKGEVKMTVGRIYGLRNTGW